MSQVSGPTSAPSNQLYGVLYSVSWSATAQCTPDPANPTCHVGASSLVASSPLDPLVPADVAGVEVRGHSALEFRARDEQQ